MEEGFTFEDFYSVEVYEFKTHFQDGFDAIKVRVEEKLKDLSYAFLVFMISLLHETYRGFFEFFDGS